MTFNSSLRLAGALLLFLPALLTVLPPGLNVFWKLSIPVKEVGFLLTVPCLLLALWTAYSWNGGLIARAAFGLSLVGALLYAYPLIRAILSARQMQREFAVEFSTPAFSPRTDSPKAFLRSKPLVWRDFFRDISFSSSREGAKQPRTLTYARKNGLELQLDFYPGVGAGPRPCVIVIHGGGWDSGNRKQLPKLNDWLARDGYSVASISYRLAPEYTYPAPVEDVADAIAYLKKHGADLGVDPTRFILVGRSAGGQIALQSAYTLKDPAIKAVVAFYAPADMVFGYSLPGNPLILDSRGVMDSYLGGSCGLKPELCRNSSPLEFADADSPPTLLLHGEPDVLVSFKHTVHLEQKLTLLGVPHFSVKLPWATHGYDYMFSGLGSQISLYFIERFLDRTAR